MQVLVTGLRASLPVLLLLLVTGCGSSNGREAVQGTVKFKGQPLEHGTIEFQPENTSGSATFEGATIANGKYEVPAEKGLLPGKYKVVISSADPHEKEVAEDAPPGESGPPAKELIPARYNSESQEVVEVKKGGPNTFDYDIK
jgi:hypothetical protein